MKKYRVHGVVTGGKYLGEVEAENEKQAKEKGFDLESNYVSLCHQCAGEVEDPEIHEIIVEVIK